MIEPLTKAKLKQYGFDKQSIERLTTWKDYECEIINDRGYFFASNKEHKIYSGIEGKQKHLDKSIFPEHNSDAKEKFVTFEELFRYAVLADSITVPESKLGKQFDYKNAESIHNFSFNVWLQNFKGWEYGNETTYIENLTRENWVEYLTHCENEKQKHNEEAEKIKSNWKPKAIPPQQTETKSSNTSNRPIIADFVERLRAEVEMDELFLRAEKIRKEKGVVNSARQKNETKTEQRTPKTFEELFYKPEHAEPCLKILSELQPPVIDAINNYIGKAKGVFPLWVNVLKNHKPEPLIRHFKDTVYKDLLNQKVKGLNLSKDASEFRKQYVRLINDKTELDIKTILSQYSQSGKLGK